MQALTVKIPIKDSNGRQIGEKEVATYAGLLSRAHDEGLVAIVTMLIQAPTKENGGIAIASAVVETSKGKFAGIGDAAENSVNRRILPHIIRMAETRAKAQALRDAVNIGMVCLEELGGAEGDEDVSLDDRQERDNVRELPRREERPRDHERREAREPDRTERRDDRQDERGHRDARGQDQRRGDDRRGGDQISDAQKRMLYRLLADAGFEGQAATDRLLEEANVDSLADIGKRQASQLIDRFKARNAA